MSDLWEQAEHWAVWYHPIVRFKGDPVPQLGTGDYGAMEELYFEKIEDPEIDDFYLELAPADSYPS